MPIPDECLIELYHTCKSVLAEFGGDADAAKEDIRQIFEEADEKPCDEVYELFLNAVDVIHDLEKRKPPQVRQHHEAAAGQNRPAQCSKHHHCPTAAAENQEG